MKILGKNSLAIIALFSFYLRNYQFSNSISFLKESFIKLTELNKGSDIETYSYRDRVLNAEYLISRKSFKNGLVLINLEGTTKLGHSELRVVIKKGTSSDPSEFPGIRHFSFKLFSIITRECMKDKYRESGLNWKLKLSLNTSIIDYLIEGDPKNFFKCFISTIKTKNFKSLKNSYVSTAEEFTSSSNEFMKSFKSITSDISAIEQIAALRSGLENRLLQICSLFSVDNYRNVQNLNNLLEEKFLSIIKESFLPSLLVFIFSGNTKIGTLTGYLSSLTKSNSEKIQLENNNSELDSANKLLNKYGNYFIYRFNSEYNALRFYIPFNPMDFDTISSNSQFFILNLLNSRHSGGIINFLFLNDLIDANSLGTYFEYKSNVIYINLRLTEKGISSIPLIIDSVVSYINLISKSIIVNKIYIQSQEIFDEYITANPRFFLTLIQQYFTIHNIFSFSTDFVLKSNVNSQFDRSKVEKFVSSMNLDSITISVSLTGEMDLYNVVPKNKIHKIHKFSNFTEKCTGKLYLIIDLNELYDVPFSKIIPRHAYDAYGLTLPNDEPISAVVDPNFYLGNSTSKFILLHDAIELHYQHLNYIGKEVIISQTMAFKSITTTDILYLNNQLYDRNVNLNLKFSVKEWNHLMESFRHPRPISILAALNIITAILNIKCKTLFGNLIRFGGSVVFLASQSYLDDISDPFELFLTLKVPVKYLTYVFEQLSSLLNSLDPYFYDRDILKSATSAAIEALDDYYDSMNVFSRNLKIITQSVSSYHATYEELRHYIENGMTSEFLLAVSRSILYSPNISGFIDGDLTPFQANHALNIFIEAIGHADFNRSVDEGPITMDKIPPICIKTNSGILDVDSVPANMRKLLLRIIDTKFSGSYASIAILLGFLDVENYAKSLFIKEIYENEVSNKVLKVDQIFHSYVRVISNKFLAVELSLKTNSSNSDSLLEYFYEIFLKITKKLSSNLESKSYSKKILDKVKSKEIFSVSSSSVLAIVNQSSFISSTKEFISEINPKDLKFMLNDVGRLPSIIIVTQGRDDETTEIPDMNYIPYNYTLIHSPKELLNSKGIRLFY